MGTKKLPTSSYKKRYQACATFEEIAQALGITAAQAREAEIKAIKKIRIFCIQRNIDISDIVYLPHN